MKQLYRSLLDWAEYAYVLLFITIVITVYSIFIYFEQRNLEKNAPAKSTVLDGHPDRNIENIIKIQTQKKSTIDDLWPYVLRGAAQQC